MKEPVDLTWLTPIGSMRGDDPEDSALLRQMAQKAEVYLRSFEWCPAIEAMYLGYGVGGVIAVFLARLTEKVAGTDEWLWVAVGDLRLSRE
jgi:hypothetical protein